MAGTAEREIQTRQCAVHRREYHLGNDAEALLQARGIIPSGNWVRALRIGGGSTAPSRIFELAHDHMASHIALEIEIGARETKDVRFRNHIEIIRDAPERTQRFPNPLRLAVPTIPATPKWIEPDALFALDDRLFAIEADTGSESIEAIIKPKIRAYRELFSSEAIHKHLGTQRPQLPRALRHDERKAHAQHDGGGRVDRAQRAQHHVRLCVPARPMSSSRARRLPTGGCFASRGKGLDTTIWHFFRTPLRGSIARVLDV